MQFTLCRMRTEVQFMEANIHIQVTLMMKKKQRLWLQLHVKKNMEKLIGSNR